MKKEDLRIVFMGTPEFAVETLKALVENNYNVVGVVTQPDKPVGRHGSVLQPSAVKQYAVEQGLPVLQPEKMKDPEFVEQLRSLGANLQVVVAFRMLPEVVWAMPEYGTFNVHAALLPDYRGAAPINWAVINGEQLTGVTTFFLDHQIDTGRIIRQAEFPIPDEADVEYVYDGLMTLGAQLCLQTLADIVAADGHPQSLPQDDAKAVHPAPKLFKENTRIEWGTMTAKQVYDFVRGLSPVPGAWTVMGLRNYGHGMDTELTRKDTEGIRKDTGLTRKATDGTVLKIYKATKTERPVGDAEPGTLERDKRHLFVACRDCWLQIDSLQAAGKKRMDAAAFMNGIADIEKYSLA